MIIVHKSQFAGSLVWIFSAVVIAVYITYGMLGYKTPGVEQLVAFLSSLVGWQIYIAAFISMFLEGLYFVGSFFPGSSLVVLFALLAQVGGIHTFLITIVCIFVAWCLSGVANVTIAKLFRWSVANNEDDEFEVHDRVWTTWFPAFRSSYEVAQASEGAQVSRVLVASFKVKLYVSIAMALVTLVLAQFIDVNHVSNVEGYTVLGSVGLITLVVGMVKLRRSLSGVHD